MMEYASKLLFIFLLILFSSSIASPIQRISKKTDIQVVINGETLIKLPMYNQREVAYLTLKDIARIYSAKMRWLSASGKVNLELNNKNVQFVLNTKNTKINGANHLLSKPVKLERGKVYIPFDFVLGDHFRQVSEYTTEWNEEKQILTVEKRANVFPPRVYSYSDHSRIVVEIDENLNCQIEKKSNRISIYILKGILEKTKTTDPCNDGVLRKITSDQQRRQAKITIYLGKYAGKYYSQILSNPPKVVIDITRIPGKLGTEVSSSGTKNTSKDYPKTISKPSPPVTNWVKPEPILPATELRQTCTIQVETGLSNKDAENKTGIAGISAKYPGMAMNNPEIKTVVIDPGHGGKDPGAIGPNGTKEKDINLAVAREIARLLREEEGIKVILTRNSDVFIPLDQRNEIANKNCADLFVSIHCNSSISAKNSGFEIYYLAEKATDSAAEAVANAENSVIALENSSSKKYAGLKKLLSSLCVNQFINNSSALSALILERVKEISGLETRKIKQADFFVLRGTAMTSVLAEIAFLSNPREEMKLKRKVFQNKMADAIYLGILDYAKRINK